MSDPEHERAEREALERSRAERVPSVPFDARPRASSEPKIAAADPLEGVPRLRAVSNLGDFAAQLDRASRDTEPTDLLGDDEKTPADRPFEIRVERELRDLRRDVDAIKKSSLAAAQHAVDTYALVKEIDRRQRAYDVERRWIPWAFRVATFALALWALLRTYR